MFIFTNISSRENFQSRWGTLACNIYDLHTSIKTSISNTEYIESTQIPSVLCGFYNSFHTKYWSNFLSDGL